MGFQLFYFTETYPFGLGEAWKTNELEVLSKHFQHITVFPLWFGNNPVPRPIEQPNVTVMKPAFDSLNVGLSFSDLRFLFDKAFFSEFIREKLFAHPANLKKALRFRKFAFWMKNSDSFQQALKTTTQNTVWYFFWGRGWSDVLPFHTTISKKKIAIRFHGYDLYLERNNGYIPFRKDLLNAGDLILPISNNGANYLRTLYPKVNSKIEVLRLGTKSKGISGLTTARTMRLVSCSSLVPVKRLDRLVLSIREIQDFPIEWTHVGSGPLLQEIEQLIKTLPPNISVKFAGHMSPENVMKFLVKNEFDLFINTSDYEGVPVSIMEALSAGIPVMATDVGGTSEIVDDSVGKLLPHGSTINQISQCLRDYYYSPLEVKLEWRRQAFKRYEEKCDAEKLGQQLASRLLT